MKPLLLLHIRADVNTNDIWRAAIRAGWTTERIDMAGRINVPPGTPKVRYYGNTLHAAQIADKLPFHFLPLDLKVLAATPLAKRSIWLCKLSELATLRKSLNGYTALFIKPAQEKWFPARVYESHEQVVSSEEGSGSLPDDLVYVQSVTTFVNEIRCFCLNGEILTSSYYRIGAEYAPLNCDEFRPGVIDSMVKELAPFYPPGVVLDFGYTDKGQYSFIEPNESFASGIYGCDPERCLDVIEASQVDK